MVMQRLIILTAIFVIFGVQGKNYDGYKVIRFIPRTESELKYLKELFDFRVNELDFWLEPRTIGKPTDVMVSPDMLSQFLREINVKVQGSFTTLIDDVGALISAQNRPKQYEEDYQKHALADFDYSIYHTYDEINLWIENIAGEYSDLASTFVIGTSYEGRAMNALKIGSGKSENRRAIWMNGGIHSREWISPATVIYMVNELLENYEKDSEVTKLLDEIDWYVLPLHNVDGYNFTWVEDRLWRKTRSYHSPNLTSECAGVDPNRNWDIDFAGNGSSSDPCSIIYCGPAPFSEVEVRAVAEFVNKSNPETPDFDLFLDVHSYSQLILTPWSWSTDLPKDYDIQYDLARRAADALTAVHGTEYECGTSANVLGISSGVSKDWAYEKGGILFTYTLELRDTGTYGFVLPEDQIIPTGEETFEALKEAANYILEYYETDSSTQITYNRSNYLLILSFFIFLSL